MRSYLKKYPEAVCLFYDSEFGSTPEYFDAIGVPKDRVIHSPLLHIEQLKFDLTKQLETLNRGDKVIVFIDSIGNLASKKELEDALAESSKADFTKAKALRSLFRIVTPALKIKDIPCIVIGHTYDTIETYAKQVLAGGQGAYYAADNIFFMSRSQDKKDGGPLEGYKFTIVAEKSRFIQEKSKLPLEVKFDKGISPYSGLFDLAVEGGFIVAPKQGFYCRYIDFNVDTGEMKYETKAWRRGDSDTAEFWKPLLEGKHFTDWLTDRFKPNTGTMFKATEFIEGEAND